MIGTTASHYKILGKLGTGERSFEAHDYWLLMLKLDSQVDDLRGEPRFQEVVEKVRAAIVR